MVIQPVILSGGSGSRLWPLSREHYPKQLIALCDENSLLQNTVTRLVGLDNEKTATGDSVTSSLPLIIANEEHRFLVAEQMRQINAEFEKILLEPFGRNTAPALTLAALAVNKKNDDPILLVLPADHVIQNIEEFQKSIVRGAELANDGAIVTFGIVPDGPETGYGYIKKGNDLKYGNIIAQFVEKPDPETAKNYVDSGEYLWNSGMFMMRASVWLDAIARYQPEISQQSKLSIENGSDDVDFYRVDKVAFKACPSDSIDYAVMEKLIDQSGSDNSIQGVVIPLDANWSDVGTWSSLWSVSEKDQKGNKIKGDVYTYNTRNCLVMSEYRLVATAGIDDLIVVETADAIMVAHKDHSQDVKKLVESLKADGRTQHESHRCVSRPWGYYESIDDGDRFQVKRITVNPGSSLSLQMHHHRAEHWIVVKGTAKVTRNGEEVLLAENESTYIPLGVSHRLENPGVIPLELIEVQSGSYLGEDDIVRYDDVYGRAAVLETNTKENS